MRAARHVWTSLFDIREGELGRTLWMSLYLLFVMFAYYILKPVSRSMFLNEFKVDRLPYLNMLIAAGGGILAYLYSNVAIRTSLQTAVTLAMGIAASCLLAFWWLVTLQVNWLLYVFNVWVSLFSIVLVSQGWLVASNVFDSRAAKRLYGLLGLGAVAGAAFGGTFTAFTARLIGSRHLLLASMAMVALAYGAFRCAIVQRGVSLAGSPAADSEAGEFTFRGMVAVIGANRHLRVIIGIITLTFVVSTLVEFQFQAMASRSYRGDALTAFFGRFQGIYVNLVTFTLQLFLTAAVVRRLGVGGTLEVMPASLAAASLGMAVAPGLPAAMCTELTDSAGRYTVNRTGMELLYLPLPVELRNRTKAFVDVFMDRMGRGLGGALLALLLAAGVRDPRQIAVLVISLTVAWIWLARRAQREYLQTVKGRLQARRLDLASSRMTVNDPSTLALLEETAASSNARQACYALSLLAEAPDYDLAPLLGRLAATPSPEVRAKVYELAWFTGFGDLHGTALEQIRAVRPDDSDVSLKPAVIYVLAFSPDPLDLARELLSNPHSAVAESVIEAVRMRPDWACELITPHWLAAASAASDPERRRIGALAISLRGDQNTGALLQLLEDADPRVAAEACRAAGALWDPAYVRPVVARLADARVRGAAIEALASYGAGIAETLSEIFEDGSTPVAIRRQIPRVLRRMPDQRNVDILLRSIGHQDISIRAAVLKALNELRERAPGLDYGDVFVTRQILSEARNYFELHAALEPFHAQKNAHTAAGLLARSLEERYNQTVERLFRLLGLRYPQHDIQAAHAALRGNRTEQMAAALDFLESILDHSLRRVVLPLLDSSGRVIEKGRDLFGVEVAKPEEAVRELIHSGDPWLAACAIAAAAEQRFYGLAPDVAAACQQAGEEVSEVARSAMAALAPA